MKASARSKHAAFAGVHAVRDFEAGDAGVGDLHAGEEFRDDAEDFAAGGKGCVRDGAHQADAATAVDEADAGLGEALAHGCCGGEPGGVPALAGAAEDDDGFGQGRDL